MVQTMPSAFARVLLFLSSYFPLLVILTITQGSTGHPHFAAITLGLAAIGIVGSWLYFQLARRLAAVTITPSAVRAWRSTDWFAYLSGYALPLLNLVPGDEIKTLGVGILLTLFLLL